MQIRRRQFLNLAGLSIFGYIINACSHNISLNSSSSDSQFLLNKFDVPDMLSKSGELSISLYDINNESLLNDYILPLAYSTLVDFDVTDGKLYPGIASNLEVINPQNFLFTIRDDIYFHPDKNGFAAPLTIEGIMNDFNVRINNQEPFFYTVIESLEIIDNKLLVSLKNPFPYFIEFISNSSIAGIRHNDTYDDSDLFRGSGPYVPTQINEYGYVLVANNFYHEKGLPLLNYIYINMYFNIDLMRKDFENNSFDLILSKKFVNLLNSIPLNYDKHKYPSKEVVFFALSMTKMKGGRSVKYIEAFQSPKVRKALSKSINRKLLIETFDAFLTGLVPPSFPLDSLNNDEINQIDFMTYDPIAARQLLFESGFSGLEFRIDLPNTVFFSKLGSLLVNQLSKVGFAPRLVFRDLSNITDSLEIGDFESILYSQKFDLSPDTGLKMSTSSGTKDQYSQTGFSSPIYDHKVQESFNEYDPILSGQLAKNAQKNLFDQSPAVLPIFCNADVAISYKNQLVSGFQFEKLSSNFKIFSKYWMKHKTN